MREFLEEYGGIIVIVLIGIAVLSGIMEIIRLISEM